MNLNTVAIDAAAMAHSIINYLYKDNRPLIAYFDRYGDLAKKMPSDARYHERIKSGRCIGPYMIENNAYELEQWIKEDLIELTASARSAEKKNAS